MSTSDLRIEKQGCCAAPVNLGGHYPYSRAISNVCSRSLLPKMISLGLRNDFRGIYAEKELRKRTEAGLLPRMFGQVSKGNCARQK